MDKHTRAYRILQLSNMKDNVTTVGPDKVELITCEETSEPVEVISQPDLESPLLCQNEGQIMSPSGDLANLLERVTKSNEENFEFGPTTEKRTGESHITDDVASLENQRGFISDLHNCPEVIIGSSNVTLNQAVSVVVESHPQISLANLEDRNELELGASCTVGDIHETEELIGPIMEGLSDDQETTSDPEYVPDADDLRETDKSTTRKRAKKGHAQPGLWHQNKNIELRMKGKQYTGTRRLEGESDKILKPARKLKERCVCKLTESRQCAIFTDEDRNGIFENIWQQPSWDCRKTLVSALIDKKPICRRRSNGDQSRRNYSLFYFLKKNGEKKPVCKKMFLSTTGLGEWSVHNWVSHADTYQDKDEDGQHKRESSHYNRAQNEKRFMREQFLDLLPKLPSHYCRKTTQKLYLEQTIQSMADLYRLYVTKCTEENQNPLCIRILKEEFEKKNLALFKPKKDRCDTCVAHETGNLSDLDFSLHRDKISDARQEKNTDKEQAEVNDRLRVMTMDVQAVLLSPSLNASALYYKTKLTVHNFTMYDLRSHDVKCYVWHEGEAGLSASEFASCVADYLTVHAHEYDTAILYSDGCTYQNRNVVMANTLLSLSKRHGKVIQQKFLERGHTQMEVDSAHSLIERKTKNVNIYVPADYVNIMKTARNPPYDVKYLEHNFFKDYSDIGPYKSLRPGSKVGDPKVTDLRCLKYLPNGDIMYKVNYQDEWQELPMPRNIQLKEPSVLHPDKIKIKETKFQHLQQLKNVMPKDYHSFYDQLHH